MAACFADIFGPAGRWGRSRWLFASPHSALVVECSSPRAFMAPLGWERRTVVTVHDLHYLDLKVDNAGHERYFRRVIVPQLRRCRRVLTVSDHSAAELHDVLGDAGAERADIVVVGDVAPGLRSTAPPVSFVGAIDDVALAALYTSRIAALSRSRTRQQGLLR